VSLEDHWNSRSGWSRLYFYTLRLSYFSYQRKYYKTPLSGDYPT